MKYEQLLIQRIRRGALSARACLGIVVTVGAAACAPSPNPTHQTVDYYRANRDAREAKLAECANDPGTLRNTPDCVNARQAGNLESIGSLRDLPPLQLSTDRNSPGSSKSNDSAAGSLRATDSDNSGQPQ
jgi:hypothetical protein